MNDLPLGNSNNILSGKSTINLPPHSSSEKLKLIDKKELFNNEFDTI